MMTLWEILLNTSSYFDNYSDLNQKLLDECRKICKNNGIYLDNQHDDAVFKKYGTPMSVEIDKLLIGQKHVKSDVLQKKKMDMDLKKYKPVHVFKYKNSLILHDGHHRTVRLRTANKRRVNSYVLNLDKYD